MTRLASEQTVGISPKVGIPSALLALAGAALMVLDLLAVVDVPDEIWVTLLGSGGVTFGAGYAASPGLVVAPDTPQPGRSSWGSEKG
jgi:hypothetical protein